MSGGTGSFVPRTANAWFSFPRRPVRFRSTWGRKTQHPTSLSFGRGLGQFPTAERGRLLEWVNRWNDHNPWLTASVRRTADGSQLRIVGNSTLFVVLDSEFPVLRRSVDLSLGAALKLFEAVNDGMVLPSTTQLEQWFDWTG